MGYFSLTDGPATRLESCDVFGRTEPQRKQGQFLHSLPGMSMKSTFEANSNVDAHQKVRQAVVQRLLEIFTQKRDELLQSMPEATKPANTPVP